MGIQLEADGGIGKIKASSLKKNGKTYVNEVFGKSAVTLNIQVESGVGGINLEQSQ